MIFYFNIIIKITKSIFIDLKPNHDSINLLNLKNNN